MTQPRLLSLNSTKGVQRTSQAVILRDSGKITSTIRLAPSKPSEISSVRQVETIGKIDGTTTMPIITTLFIAFRNQLRRKKLFSWKRFKLSTFVPTDHNKSMTFVTSFSNGPVAWRLK